MCVLFMNIYAYKHIYIYNINKYVYMQTFIYVCICAYVRNIEEGKERERGKGAS